MPNKKELLSAADYTKIEKMGFETNKRIRREFHNEPTWAQIDGQTYHFRSKFECRWAKYLQFLKERGAILDWQYEPHRFYFHNPKTAPVSYLPDFLVLETYHKTVVWQECKGLLEPRDATKFQRMAEQYPKDEIELVMQRIPKKGNAANRLDRIQRKQWVSRVIDASKIFRQCKGVI